MRINSLALGVNAAKFVADSGDAVGVVLTQAQGDLTIADNDAAGRTPVPAGPVLNPGSRKGSVFTVVLPVMTGEGKAA